MQILIWKVPARERLVNIGIRPSAHSVKNETGCKAGDKCLFPHHEVDEQPNKKPKKGYYSHKRRESDDKNAVALVKIVSHLGCVSQDSDALVSQGGKSRRNPMQKVLEPIQRVRFTKSSLRRASFRELQQRCARSKAWNLAKNIYKLKEKDKAAFYFPAQEWVLLVASTKVPKEREFVVA